MFIRTIRTISCATLLTLVFSANCHAAEITTDSIGELISAAEKGRLIQVQNLLQQGVDPNIPQADGTTALHWAVRQDQTLTSLELLAAGALATASDRYGITPLKLAAINGNVTIMQGLLEAGANANGLAPTGESILMTATRTGLIGPLELLIKYGAVVDYRDSQYQQTALMLAVRENHPEAATLLIMHGADVNARTRTTATPKFKPPCKGTGCGSEGVGINRGGLPDRGRRGAAKGGMTPLLYASREGQTELAQILINENADLEIRDANDISPILMALLNNQLDVAGLLLDNGADINVADSWGRSPLFAVVDYRNLDMNNRAEDSPTHNGVDRAPVLAFIERLLEQGAEVNAQTRDVPPTRKWLYSLNDVSWVDFTGQTPFLRAALSADIPAMRLLLSYGADSQLPTFAETTPLMAAAGVNWVVAQTYTESEQAQLDTVAFCLELGADANASNSMGLTALLGAANRGSNEIIRLLVSKGARLDITDVEGRTPKRWAEGVFLAAVGAEIKPNTIALLDELEEQGLKANGAN